MPGAHRYWKLGDLVSTDGDYIVPGECYLRQTFGGANEIPVAYTSSPSINGIDLPPLLYDGNPATYWHSASGYGHGAAFVAFDYGSPIDPAQLMMQAASNNVPSRTPNSGTLYFSDTGLSGPWFAQEAFTFVPGWALGDIQTFNFVIGGAANINAPQGGGLVVLRAAADSLHTPQAQFMVPYNVPADTIKATFAGFNIPYRRIAQAINVTQSNMMVVTRGKITNPKLVAWAYTLDGHDYYILKLGTEGKTLVFDVSTGTWSWWSSVDSQRWRLNCGMNWRSSGNISSTHGSNVIVGDDSYGVLWVLDPEAGVDDHLLSDSTVTFPRVATGQMTTKDRNFLPIYSVNLTSSLGEPSLTLNTVTLEYSDDQGHTFVTADAPQVAVSGNYDQDFMWLSLGLVRAPGRLFRISDDGAFARIDSLDVNA